MEIDKEALGNRINAIRVEKGLTLEEFGKLILNANKSVVSKWEKGITVPNNQRLNKIAELGNMTVDYLMYGSISDFILKNLKDFLPSDYKFIAGSILSDTLFTILKKVKEDNVSVFETEKIKSIFEENLPLIISDIEKYYNKFLRFITSQQKYKKQAIEYFSSGNSSFIKSSFNKSVKEIKDDIEYIFENGKNFTLEEICSFDSKIEDLYTFLDGVIHKSVNFTDSIAFLINENSLHELKDINIQSNPNFNTIEIYDRLGYKPLPWNLLHYKLLVEIKSKNIGNIVQKDDYLLIRYYPELQHNILKKYFTNQKIVIIQNDEIFIGNLDKNLIFKSVGEKTFSIDLNNISISDNVFPLVSIFY